MRRTVAVLTLALLPAWNAAAQWPNAPTPDIARLADGRPNLAAPAPRLENGTPDLSGIWVLKATMDPGFLGLPYGPEFISLGAALEAGLPYQPWAAARVEANKANQRIRDPLSHCMPIGPVRQHTITFYRELIQLPGKIVLLNEYNSAYRQVFTDGRRLPEDPVPVLNGYSSGRWVKDTLVVETRGFRDGAIWLDAVGSPLTDAARITERFRRVSLGELQIEITVDDPKAYTRPWTVTLVQRLAPDLELAEAFCAEEQLVALGAPGASNDE